MSSASLFPSINGRPMPWTLSEEWKKMLGEKWQHVHETYLHTIGNLTLSAPM
jgi:hypothetical protein